MTRAFLASAVALVVAPVAVVLGLAAVVLEDRPRVETAAALGIDDVEGVQRLLRENDPRRLRDGERRRAVFTQRDLNLLLRYAMPPGSAARIDLTTAGLRLQGSARLGDTPLGAWLNITLHLAATATHLEPRMLSLGALGLPGGLTRGLIDLGDTLLRRAVPEYGPAIDHLESLQVEEGALAITYRWRRVFLEQLKDRGPKLLMAREDRRGVLDYYHAIVQRSPYLRPDASLMELLRPLFARARERSAAGRDPARENRFLLLALGMAIQGADPDRLRSPGDAPLPYMRRPRVTLHGRRDLAQHFVISAALATGGGSGLADVVGVFKELSDSRGGSGFSFADLLADRAGVVFAGAATGPAAATLQQRLADAVNDGVVMPRVDALPEGLQELQFRSRYEDLDTDAYARVTREVERRISALPLYRQGEILSSFFP